MSRTPGRIGHPRQPPRLEVRDVQLRVATVLARTSARHDAGRVLAALAAQRTDDVAGLHELLAELELDSPAALAELLQLVAASASYAALTWSRGLTTSAGVEFGAQDVLGAAWTQLSWREAEPSLGGC